MQIERVKISNIMSFPYMDNFSTNHGVTLGTGGDAAVNVLIGPNGSGKSNFILILHHIFRFGIPRDYIYDKQLLLTQPKGPSPKAISCNTTPSPSFQKIYKHFDYQDKESRVQVSFMLGDLDYENI